MQAAFKARAALLQTVDLGSGRMLGLHSGGPGISEAVLTCTRNFHTIDPRRLHDMAQGPAQFGQRFHCHDAFAEAFVTSDLFCQYFRPAYRTRYCSIVTYGPEGSVITGFALELPAARSALSADERKDAVAEAGHAREIGRFGHRSIVAEAAVSAA